MITQSYKLNIVPHAEQTVRGFVAPVVHESQYDVGMRTLIFTLYKEGELYTILEGQTVHLFGTKPDGNAFEYEMTIVDNHTVSIVDNIQMTCVAGLVICEIVVFGTQNDRIGSANFVLCIEPAAVDADQTLSDTDIPVFNEILYGGEVGEILTKTANGAEWAPQGTGTGYMIKAEYDPDDDGSVLKADHADDASTVDGFTVARNVLADEYTNAQIDTMIAGAGGTPAWGDITGTLSNQTDLKNALDAKQDAEAGKGLSEEDFTSAEKTKLSGIESGAEVNVQANWTEADSSSDAYIQNKPTIPAKVSDLQNDSGYITGVAWGQVTGTLSSQTDLKNALDGKVDTVAGKGLSENDFTDTLKDKLDGIEANAEVNVQADWNEADNTKDDYIKNKPSIPTKISDLTNDTGFITGVAWGSISGALSSQTDLQTALNGKQGTLTAGSNITISTDNVISASGGGGTGGHTIVNSAGTDMAQRAKLKFSGATVTDDSANDMTVVSGLKGDQGDPGTAATIAVGAVTSGATASVTNSGTSSAAVFDFVLPKGDKGDTGPAGADGSDGAAGADGFSPTVSTTTISGGTQVTITDKNGPHTFDVMDGAEGQQGPAGQDGTDGTDGFSPTVSVSTITGGSEITITDANGPHVFDVMDGANGAPGQEGAPGQDGAPGADGYSPTVSTSSITGGTAVTITDKNGPHVFNVMDGADGQTGQTGPAGADGFSPIATVTKSGSTATISITDKNGTTTATVSDGSDAAAVWGSITGTLTSQTDLATALGGKLDNPSGGTAGQILKKTAGGTAWDDEIHQITVTVATSDWGNQTTIDGVAYYPAVKQLTAIYDEHPIIGIGAASTLPTSAEQAAYDSWDYAVVNDANTTLTLYAKAVPSSDFKIIVKGVE